MKVTLKVEKEFDIKTLHIEAGVRYWEDGTVNGVEDMEGTLIPFREEDYWKPVIDLDTHTILNWPKGTTASVHYKVCDDGCYYLKDAEGRTVLSLEDEYVPNALIPGDCGDYIEMEIDENGVITNWNEDACFDNFTQDDED